MRSHAHGMRIVVPIVFIVGGLIVSGCGRGNKPRLAEFRMPPKPKPEQIATARQQMHANMPSVSPFPTIAPLQLARTWSVKETAADALARIGPAAIPVLAEALSDRDPEVRMQAANSLARMGPPAKDAVPKLIVALRDSHREVRRAAARALGQIGTAATDAIPALIEVIRDPNSDKPSKEAAGKDQS